MSAIPTIMYLGGIFTFGFLWWLLNGIKNEFEGYSETGSVFDLMNYFWLGIIIVYLLFGGYWLIRIYNEKQYMEM